MISKINWIGMHSMTMTIRPCLFLVLGIIAIQPARPAPILTALGNPDNPQFVNPSEDVPPAILGFVTGLSCEASAAGPVLHWSAAPRGKGGRPSNDFLLIFSDNGGKASYIVIPGTERSYAYPWKSKGKRAALPIYLYKTIAIDGKYAFVPHGTSATYLRSHNVASCELSSPAD